MCEATASKTVICVVQSTHKRHFCIKSDRMFYILKGCVCLTVCRILISEFKSVRLTPMQNVFDDSDLLVFRLKGSLCT